MNWGDWIREGLDIDYVVGEATTVLLEMDSRRYDKDKRSKIREWRKSKPPCPAL